MIKSLQGVSRSVSQVDCKSSLVNSGGLISNIYTHSPAAGRHVEIFKNNQEFQDGFYRLITSDTRLWLSFYMVSEHRLRFSLGGSVASTYETTLFMSSQFLHGFFTFMT